MFTYIKNKYNSNPMWVLEGSESPKNLLIYNIEFDTAPYLRLTKTVDEFYEMHKSKFWYNIKRDEKLFSTEFGRLDFIVISEKNELLQYLPKIQELFANRWEKDYTSFEWKTKTGFQKYHDAMIDLASTGNGEIALLAHNQTILAFAYCLKYEKTYYFFQHAVSRNPLYRKYSLGKILIRQLIESAIQREFEIFDFMTGNQAYKKEWANDRKKVYIHVAGNKNLCGFLTTIPKIVYYTISSFVHKNEKIKSPLKSLLKLNSI